MCVGIDHRHRTKIDVFAWEGLLFLQKTKRLKKYLIIRLSSIGDIVLTTPVVRCLKEQSAPCQVHYLTRRVYKEVVSANPYIDRVFTINDSVEEVLPMLKAENYDQIIDLHKNWRSMAVRRKLGIKSTSFSKLNIRKWLLVNCKIDRLPRLHIVDRYMQAVADLGVTNDGRGLDYFIPPEVTVPRDSLPPSHRQGYVAVVIGGRHNTKQLPAEKTIALCLGIKAPVILLGGPEDSAHGDTIAAADPGHIFNACGKFSLSQSARLVENAALVITNDTGLMHVAAAFNKKIISVWGNTVPEFGMYPYMPEHPNNFSIFEVKGLSCRPCSKIGFEKCPRGHFRCMMQQDIGGMIAMANGIVKEGVSGVNPEFQKIWNIKE
jgi:ADP-heptose:LPS heptosyltransferase